MTPPPQPPQIQGVDPGAVTVNFLKLINNTFQQLSKAITSNLTNKLKEKESSVERPSNQVSQPPQQSGQENMRDPSQPD